MAEVPNNRPRGREQNITGKGKDIYIHGEGLGTGPAGAPGGHPGARHGGDAAARDVRQQQQLLRQHRLRQQLLQRRQPEH